MWAERYLEEEKMRLAGLYHKRTLLEKGFIGMGGVIDDEQERGDSSAVLGRMRDAKYALMRACN